MWRFNEENKNLHFNLLQLLDIYFALETWKNDLNDSQFITGWDKLWSHNQSFIQEHTNDHKFASTEAQ